MKGNFPEMGGKNFGHLRYRCRLASLHYVILQYEAVQSEVQVQKFRKNLKVEAVRLTETLRRVTLQKSVIDY